MCAILRTWHHIASDHLAEMTIRNIKRIKKEGPNFEMTFYEDQSDPGHYHPLPADQPPFDLDQFREEMQEMARVMAEGIIRHARDQVVQEAADKERRLLQEIDALKERVRVLERRSMNKRPEADKN